MKPPKIGTEIWYLDHKLDLFHATYNGTHKYRCEAIVNFRISIGNEPRIVEAESCSLTWEEAWAKLSTAVLTKFIRANEAKSWENVRNRKKAKKDKKKG